MKNKKAIITIVGSGSNSEITADFSKFSDGDSHCLVNDIDKIKNKNIIVRYNLYPHQNDAIINLLLLLSTLKEYGAKTIDLFVPYLPYARQDKRYEDGEALSIDVICGLLKNSGLNSLHTLDCHFSKGRKKDMRAGLEVYNHKVINSLIDNLVKEESIKQFTVIGPDDGAKGLINNPIQTMHKTRGNVKHEEDLVRCNVIEHKSEHLNLKTDSIIIVDDMISTGSTMISAVKQVRDLGAKRIYCATTHGLFLNDSQAILTELCDRLVYSNSVTDLPNTAIDCDDYFSDKVLPEIRLT